MISRFYSRFRQIGDNWKNKKKRSNADFYLCNLMLAFMDKCYEDLYSNVLEAFKNESEEYYEDSAYYYTIAYEEIKSSGRVNSRLNEVKNYFEKKISKMKYEDAMTYYNDKYYSTAIDKFKESINNKYMTYDIKKDCEKKLGQAYEQLAKEKWNIYNADNMSEAIDFLTEAEKFNSSVGTLKKNYNLYYHLYLAYNESNLYIQRSRIFLAKDYADYGMNLMDLYYKLVHVIDLKTCIERNPKYITDLKNEFNSINNDINNIQMMINAKNKGISDKNKNIDELNKLANSLISKSNEINEQTTHTVDDGKNQIKQVEKNIKKKNILLKK